MSTGRKFHRAHLLNYLALFPDRSLVIFVTKPSDDRITSEITGKIVV